MMPTNFSTIGIITKKNIKENLNVLATVIAFLKKQNKEILFDEYSAGLLNKSVTDREKIIKQSDLIIAIGGDGTLLKTARLLTLKKTPILGVNVGTFGFLPEVDPQKKILIESLERVFKGDYKMDRRFILRVTVYRKSQKIFTSLALNEAVINQGNFARLIKLKVQVNQRKVSNIKADGLIISTPTGSTGHSLSAGGPIVHYAMQAFIMTPVCPATLAIRPIIIPNNRQLEIIIATHRREEKEGSDIGLTLDGQVMFPLKFGDIIKIRKSKKICHFIRLHRDSAYYQRLREKFNWGGEDCKRKSAKEKKAQKGESSWQLADRS